MDQNPSPNNVFQLSHCHQLAVVVDGPGPAVGVFDAVEGVKAQAMPKLVATGAGDLVDGLLLQVGQAPLQVLDLGN